MAKLDEFGRPIYETAEEYNKAHKGGVCPRPYDSPDGSNYQHNVTNTFKSHQSAAQRHATQAGSQKAKKILIAFGVFFLVLYAGIIISIITTTNDYEYYEEDFENYEDVIVNYDESEPLPEGFNEFYYNGEYYSLPTTYDQITSMGLVLEEYSENDMVPDEYEEILCLYDEDEYMRAMIRIKNYTGAEIPVGKAEVDFFWVGNLAVYYEREEVPDFVFGDGITFESSYDEVADYFGVPDYYYEDDPDEDSHYEYFQWIYYGEAEDTYELDECHYVQVSFLNGMMESVSIEKKKIKEKY